MTAIQWAILRCDGAPAKWKADIAQRVANEPPHAPVQFPIRYHYHEPTRKPTAHTAQVEAELDARATEWLQSLGYR